MRQIILDTETTGLSAAEGHRIIEIGALELIGRKYTGNHFHHYFNPERAVEAGALAVHGIDNHFLSKQGLFKEQAQNFLDYIAGSELIIHNAEFDIGFLDSELKKVFPNFQGIKKQCSVIDTLLLARQKHPGQANNLDALCRRYKVDNKHRNYHGALLDAKLLAEVYLSMTGGQIALFAMETNQEPAAAKKEEKLSSLPITSNVPLKIVLASAQELEAHQERLSVIKKKSGKVLWETEDAI